MRSRSASPTPGPVSVIENSISPDDRRRERSITAPPRGVYFTALSSRLARAWAINLAIAAYAQARCELRLEVEAVLLAGRLVELGDVGCKLAGIEGSLLARRARRLQPCDREHGGEGGEQRVGVVKRSGREPGLVAAAARLDVQQRQLELAPERRVSGERRSWAIASPAWRNPAIDVSSRASMLVRDRRRARRTRPRVSPQL